MYNVSLNEFPPDVLTLCGLAWLLLVMLLIRLWPKPIWLVPMLLYIGLGIGLQFIGLGPSETIAAGMVDLPHSSLLPPPVASSLTSLLQLLGEAGLIMLLFQAGLSANLGQLRAQLSLALRVWGSNVLLAALLGYLCARFVLQLDLITSAFIAVALTATSVGVPVALWRDSGALQSKQASFLLEIAELDDISTILLMALLIAFVPYLSSAPLHPAIGSDFPIMVAAICAFVVFAIFFSQHLEPQLTALFSRLSKRQHAVGHETVLLIIAVSLILAALSELAGLSLAIGAFIAGLAFSRDKQVAKEQPALNFICEAVTPFFFVGLGLQLQWQGAVSAIVPALLLFVAAVSGKVIGVAAPMWRPFGASAALVVGISMVPRSEVAMIVMQKGLHYGVAPEAFMTMIWVVLFSVILTALLVPWQLKRWPVTPSA